MQADVGGEATSAGAQAGSHARACPRAHGGARAHTGDGHLYDPLPSSQLTPYAIGVPLGTPVCNDVPMSTRIHIVVHDLLLEEIDARLGPGQPRADWIRRVLWREVGRFHGEATADHRSARQRALADDTHGSGALERGVDAATYTRDIPSPARAATVRGASEPSAPAELLPRACPEHPDAGRMKSGGDTYCAYPLCQQRLK
jgi:hypothetical protein